LMVNLSGMQGEARRTSPEPVRAPPDADVRPPNIKCFRRDPRSCSRRSPREPLRHSASGVGRSAFSSKLRARDLSPLRDPDPAAVGLTSSQTLYYCCSLSFAALKKCLASPERSCQSCCHRHAHRSCPGTFRGSKTSVSASIAPSPSRDFPYSLLVRNPSLPEKGGLTNPDDVYIQERRCTLRAARRGISSWPW